MVNPYTDSGNIRLFRSDVLDEELVWHRDLEDRTITIVDGEGWSFQFDDQMPITLDKGSVIDIPAMKYHRILKNVNATDLRLKIEKHRG